MKNPEKIVKVIELRAKGLSMEDIGKELGITRQTVSTYLRTPEAQAIATKLQESLLSTLESALKMVDKTIKEGLTSKNPLVQGYAAKTATNIAINLGKMVLAQTPVAQESREKLSGTERKELIERIKNNTSNGHREGGN